MIFWISLIFRIVGFSAFWCFIFVGFQIRGCFGLSDSFDFGDFLDLGNFTFWDIRLFRTFGCSDFCFYFILCLGFSGSLDLKISQLFFGLEAKFNYAPWTAPLGLPRPDTTTTAKKGKLGLHSSHGRSKNSRWGC